jgi:hypothetical protein
MSKRRCHTDKVDGVSDLLETDMEGCHLLLVEYIVISPELADGECLAERAKLVSLGEQPGCVHETLKKGC